MGSWVAARSHGPALSGGNSSPGAYGAYPFIDFDHGYHGILARQGDLGTFPEGVALFEVVADLAARWADACAAPI